MHDSLAIALAKCLVKVVAVIFGQIISYKGLTAVFVHSLQYLVGCGISEAREKGKGATPNGCTSFIFEYDAIEL